MSGTDKEGCYALEISQMNLSFHIHIYKFHSMKQAIKMENIHSDYF